MPPKIEANHLKESFHHKLCREQAGFSKDFSYVDPINSVKIISELTTEIQVQVYLPFIKETYSGLK